MHNLIGGSTFEAKLCRRDRTMEHLVVIEVIDITQNSPARPGLRDIQPAKTEGQ